LIVAPTTAFARAARIADPLATSVLADGTMGVTVPSLATRVGEEEGVTRTSGVQSVVIVGVVGM
jgi:hypothetical protein